MYRGAAFHGRPGCLSPTRRRCSLRFCTSPWPGPLWRRGRRPLRGRPGPRPCTGSMWRVCRMRGRVAQGTSYMHAGARVLAFCHQCTLPRLLPRLAPRPAAHLSTCSSRRAADAGPATLSTPEEQANHTPSRSPSCSDCIRTSANVAGTCGRGRGRAALGRVPQLDGSQVERPTAVTELRHRSPWPAGPAGAGATARRRRHRAPQAALRARAGSTAHACKPHPNKHTHLGRRLEQRAHHLGGLHVPRLNVLHNQVGGLRRRPGEQARQRGLAQRTRTTLPNPSATEHSTL